MAANVKFPLPTLKSVLLCACGVLYQTLLLDGATNGQFPRLQPSTLHVSYIWWQQI